jgi:hypothetical protein
VSDCDKCGFPLPEGAGYCPNCGAPVEKKAEVTVYPTASIFRILQAGLLGAFISVMIIFFTPPDVTLYFIPDFVAALFVVYLSRTRKYEEAITIALAVYIFTSTIINGLNYGTLFISNETWLDQPGFKEFFEQVPTLLDVVMIIADPITAIIAGYVGTRLILRTQPREPKPIAYRKRKEEPGGIIYSLERTLEKPSASSSHKV